MPLLGAHMPIQGGIAKAFSRGERVGCETMQIFSKNQRQWQAPPYEPETIAAYHAEQQRSGIRPVVVHDSYLINLASPDEVLWEKSLAAFADELERCAILKIPYLVMHPGAHMGGGETAGLHRIAEAFHRLFSSGVGSEVMVLLETTAGQGTALGYRFDHLARLLDDLVPYSHRLGVCVDTCHIFAAGYDIRTPETYAATFDEFDRIIGLDQIKVIHLNDSQKGLGSRVDRHEHIGQGVLGIEPFRLLMNDARFSSLPMILETPKGEDLEEDRRNLARLRSLFPS